MISVCGAARLGKNDVSPNQDDCAVTVYDDRLRCMIVADGIGSHPHSEHASHAAISGALAALPEDLFIEELFTAAEKTVDSAAQEYFASIGRTVPARSEFSTTLVLAAERERTMQLGWLGNGAILHIHGSAFLGERNSRAPWQSLNLLRPHMVENGQGKPALTKFISGSIEEGSFQPSIVEVSLDQEPAGDGDIFVICTDGILSAEDRKIGRVASGTTWEQIQEEELRLYDALYEIVDAPGEITDEVISQKLESYLRGLRDDGLQQDDCAVAVYMSSQFLIARQNRKGEESSGTFSVSEWDGPWQR